MRKAVTMFSATIFLFFFLAKKIIKKHKAPLNTPGYTQEQPKPTHKRKNPNKPTRIIHVNFHILDMTMRG